MFIHFIFLNFYKGIESYEEFLDVLEPTSKEVSGDLQENGIILELDKPAMKIEWYLSADLKTTWSLFGFGKDRKSTCPYCNVNSPAERADFDKV
jgi:hypothetical protein